MDEEKEVSIIINGEDITINDFVMDIVKETIIGMLTSLKTEKEGIKDFKTIEIKFNNE